MHILGFILVRDEADIIDLAIRHPGSRVGAFAMIDHGYGRHGPDRRSAPIRT